MSLAIAPTMKKRMPKVVATWFTTWSTSTKEESSFPDKLYDMPVIDHPGGFEIPLVAGRHQVGIHEQRMHHIFVRRNGISERDRGRKI